VPLTGGEGQQDLELDGSHVAQLRVRRT
jgi:hypothetical protein